MVSVDMTIFVLCLCDKADAHRPCFRNSRRWIWVILLGTFKVVLYSAVYLPFKHVVIHFAFVFALQKYTFPQNIQQIKYTFLQNDTKWILSRNHLAA